jgi:hypothetical protein
VQLEATKVGMFARWCANAAVSSVSCGHNAHIDRHIVCTYALTGHVMYIWGVYGECMGSVWGVYGECMGSV